MTTSSQGTSAQLVAVVQLVREKRDDHREPIESVLTWLTDLSAVLAGEASLDPEVMALVITHAQPRWGVRSVEESEAYLRFWEQLVRQHPHPRLRGVYAEQLSRSVPARCCEALGVFVDAVKEMPALFIDHSAAFVDLAAECPAGVRDFELAKLRFYVDLVNVGRLEHAELAETIAEVTSAFPEPSVAEEIHAITNRLTRVPGT